MKPYELTEDDYKRRRERILQQGDQIAILFQMFIESDMDKLIINYCDGRLKEEPPLNTWVYKAYIDAKVAYGHFVKMAQKCGWYKKDLYLSKHGNEFWLTKYPVDARRKDER
jgi:hypothetical protein